MIIKHEHAGCVHVLLFIIRYNYTLFITIFCWQFIGARIPIPIGPLLREGIDSVSQAAISLGLPFAPPDFGRGEPGQQVTASDARALILRPARRFLDLEIVAFQRSDGVFVYGQVHDDDGDENGEETMATESAVYGVRGVVVDVGMGRLETFVPSQLWCFGDVEAVGENTGEACRPNSCPQPSSFDRAAAGRGDVPTASKAMGPSQSRDNADDDGSLPSASSSVHTTPSTDLVGSRRSGHAVSRKQYLDAVNALLAMAGLPAGLDTSALADSNLALQARMGSLEQRAREAEEKAAAAERKLADVEEAAHCPICIQSKRCSYKCAQGSVYVIYLFILLERKAERIMCSTAYKVRGALRTLLLCSHFIALALF